MKTRTITTLFALAATLPLATTARAQGSLTPPAGPPVASMKTLDQIEARTPIESLPYTISAPGSYYFTKNLQFTATSGDAISITTNNVTLDLNGFTLSSTADVTGDAIKCDTNLTNIEIKNGKIAGNTTALLAGFRIGVNAFATRGTNLRVSQLQVSRCRSDGISAYYSIVTRSTATNNGQEGISAYYSSVTNSTATDNGQNGISAPYGSVTSSTARSNSGTGIYAAYGSVTSSTASANSGTGIYADYGSVTGSTASGNSGTGINAAYGSVTSSTAADNSHDGIDASYGSVTNCVAFFNNTSVATYYYDIDATNAVIAFTRYGTGLTTGSTLTGNKTP